MTKRKPYPTDVSDEEWSFAAPYLTLMTEGAPQRRYDLREMFNAWRGRARAGAPWRMLPHNFPPWEPLHRLHVMKALSCRSSNCPRRSRALYCCPAAGWLSAASAGSTGSGDWRATTSACPQPCQG